MRKTLAPTGDENVRKLLAFAALPRPNRFSAASLVLVTALAFAGVSAGAQAQNEPQKVVIGYLRAPLPTRTPISLIERPAEDNGLAGAKLAIEDNNTTGKFTKQEYALEDAAVSDPQQATDALGKFAAEGIHFVVADLPADLLLAVADAAAKDNILVFNAGATDDALRREHCRANVIHVAPSRSMLADALGQYLVVKKWTRWFLIVGSHDADQAYADDDQARGAALRGGDRGGAGVQGYRRRAHHRFRPGADRVADGGLYPVRRRASCCRRRRREPGVRPLRALPHLVPAPVAGTAGLRPTSWSPAHDQWGAIQLQDRFIAGLTAR